MNDAYKSKELESQSIEENGLHEKSEQQIQALITIKEEIVKLRGEVQLRFFSRAADNLGHAQRILVLQADIRNLEKRLVQRDVSHGSSTGEMHLLDAGTGFFFQTQISTKARTDPPLPSTQTLDGDHTEHVHNTDPSSSGRPFTEEQGVKLVYRSLLSQQVPVKGLGHLKPDHPAHVLKQFLVDMANGLVDKLLEIAPALDDSFDPKVTEDGSAIAYDEKCDTIVRNWFRRLVLARGQPDVLDLASRHTTIIGFLRSGVEVEELREYVEYFENVDYDALRHFRRAVDDSFLTESRPTITILGGCVSANDEVEELSTEKWDIVSYSFTNVIP